ncbi:MAG: DUF4062 domain-containing protein, partial [Tannerella sp.]|nr:DUF4062 domain-containing protein [Tannerella sp.]
MDKSWKTINIFISSTFNDMHAERDYLVKDVFPELREWCEERKINLVDIDLRWGVTEDDSTANNTVLACLKNIDESRPFFLCFLGQRRGWVPTVKDISAETDRHYPDAKTYAGTHSVTEMEIKHALIAPLRHIVEGVERQEQPVKHALFFFRNSDYLKDLTPSQRKIFTNEGETDPATADAELKKCINDIKSNYATDYYDCTWDKRLTSPELMSKKFQDSEWQGRLTGFEHDNKPLKDHIVALLKKEIL